MQMPLVLLMIVYVLLSSWVYGTAIKIENFPHENASSYHYGIVFSNDTVWSATTLGLVAWDTTTKQGKRFLTQDGLYANSSVGVGLVNGVVTAPLSRFFVRDTSWIAQWKNGQWTHEKIENNTNFEILDYAVGNNGTQWLISKDYLLSKAIGKSSWSKTDCSGSCDKMWVFGDDVWVFDSGRLLKNSKKAYGQWNDSHLLYSMVQMSDGAVYGADYSGFLWKLNQDADTFDVVADFPASTSYFDLFEGNNQQLLLASPKGKLFAYQESFNTFSFLADLNGVLLTALKVDNYGRYWASSNNGIVCIDGDKVDHFLLKGSIESYMDLSGFAEDSNGIVWYHHQWFDGSTWHTESELGEDPLYDSNGIRWFSKKFDLYRFDGKQITQVDSGYAMQYSLSLSDGRLLADGTDGRLWLRHELGWTELVQPDSMNLNLSQALEFNPGKVVFYAATGDSGQWVLDQDNLFQCQGIFPLAYNIKRAVKDSSGYFWFVAGDSLYRWDGAVAKNIPVSESLRLTKAMLYTPDQTLWIATSRALYSLNNGTWNVYREHAGELIGSQTSHLFYDSHGDIWLADFFNGLSRIVGNKSHEFYEQLQISTSYPYAQSTSLKRKMPVNFSSEQTLVGQQALRNWLQGRHAEIYSLTGASLVTLRSSDRFEMNSGIYVVKSQGMNSVLWINP